jgi:hypothetical protein
MRNEHTVPVDKFDVAETSSFSPGGVGQLVEK